MVICEVVLGRGSGARDEREARGEEEQESKGTRESTEQAKRTRGGGGEQSVFSEDR